MRPEVQGYSWRKRTLVLPPIAPPLRDQRLGLCETPQIEILKIKLHAADYANCAYVARTIAPGFKIPTFCEVWMYLIGSTPDGGWADVVCSEDYRLRLQPESQVLLDFECSSPDPGIGR